MMYNKDLCYIYIYIIYIPYMIIPILVHGISHVPSWLSQYLSGFIRNAVCFMGHGHPCRIRNPWIDDRTIPQKQVLQLLQSNSWL